MLKPSLNRRRITAFTLSVATACALAAPVVASPTANIPSGTFTSALQLANGTQATNVPGHWLVTLSAPSVSNGGSASSIETQQDKLAEAIKDAGINAKITNNYDQVWNGVSVSVSDSQAAQLAKLPGVVSVQPVIEVPRPEVKTSKELTTSEGETKYSWGAPLGMTNADRAQSELGLTGKGVKIGIIDSGIDIDHREFGGTGVSGSGTSREKGDGAKADGAVGFPNSRVIAGYDYVGDDYGANGTYDPKPDPIPDDCGGHGTHVAGIAAGGGAAGSSTEVRGVAPEASLGAYRVFGCDGKTSTDIIITAMEQATKDGMDVVNMSLGAAYMVLPDYPTTKAVKTMVDAGVVVAIAQGNDGADGLWTLGAPGAATEAITVASVDNTVETNYYFTASGVDNKFFYNVGSNGGDFARSNVAYPVVASGEADSEDGKLCTAPSDTNAFKGKYVLIRRGGCTFGTKAANAQKAGAVGVIIDNNQAGTIGMNLANEADPVKIPGVSITQADGDALRAALKADTTVTFGETFGDRPVSTGGLVSDFSSWGLNGKLEMKPDVAAPGGLIWSTWPLDHGGPFNTISGTSMATPYTAGAAALILQAHPELKDAKNASTSEGVRARLQSTGSPRLWSEGNGDKSLLEPTARQGAGLIDVYRAASTKVLPSVSRLNLGQQIAGEKTHEITLTNSGSEAVTYKLGHVDTVTTTGESSKPTRGTTNGATVSTDGTSVTVPAGSSAKVAVKVSAPAGIGNGDFYGGYVTLTPDNAAQTLRIPFVGVGGNLAESKTLYKTGPVLATEKLKVVNKAGHQFTMFNDRPHVYFKADVPLIRSGLVAMRKTDDGKYEVLSDKVFISMSDKGWNRTSTRLVRWDGSYLDANNQLQQAPEGTYQLWELNAPAGADTTVLEQYNIWMSNDFTIDWRRSDYLPTIALKASGDVTAAATTATADASTSDADPRNGKPEAMVDDNVFTYAVVSSGAPITLDAGKVYNISKVQYVPNQGNDGVDSMPATGWKAEVSVDGKTWTDAGSGSLSGEAMVPQDLTLKSGAKGRFVRITLTSDKGKVGVAELRIAGTPAGDATAAPTEQPTAAPTGSAAPTAAPTGSAAPTAQPTGSAAPTAQPTGSAAPTNPAQPTAAPSVSASSSASALPGKPSGKPSALPGKPGKGDDNREPLARTGTTIAIGIGALVLAAAGAGALALRKRRDAEAGSEA